MDPKAYVKRLKNDYTTYDGQNSGIVNTTVRTSGRPGSTSVCPAVSMAAES